MQPTPELLHRLTARLASSPGFRIALDGPGGLDRARLAGLCASARGDDERELYEALLGLKAAQRLELLEVAREHAAQDVGRVCCVWWPDGVELL